MKILKGNPIALTNFEVLDFLRSRGAAKDPTRFIVHVAPFEFMVYDYLMQSASCIQTRESVQEFFKRCKNYKLTTDEIVNIINVRPSSVVEIDPITEASGTQMGEDFEELIKMVVQVLPPPPNQMESNEDTCEDKQVIPDEK